MNIKNLVLDSNFLMRDVNFTSKDIVLLITLADYHKLKLIIPSVVYDECVGRYNVETTALRGSILSLLSKYKRKIVDIEKARIDDTGIIDKLNEVSSYYIYSIERFIKNNNISKVPYPSVHHDVIVKKMYEGKLPFKNERVELGYKDFLIVNSIKEHLDQGDVTVILSENAKDFCDGNVSNSCEKGKKNNKKKPIPISKDFNTENIYLVESVGDLSNYLSEQLKLRKIQCPWRNDEIEDFIKSELEYNLGCSSLYGGGALSIGDNKNIIVSISDVDTEISKIDNYVRITGKTKIQMDCHFEINPFSFSMINNEFVFYEKVVSAIKKLNYSENDDEFWEVKFSNYNFCHEFDFSITDFEYKEGKSIKDTFLDVTVD